MLGAPADPVNACLSLAYALLTRTFSTALTTVGLDPRVGLYHVERPGRPALALDLMEPFRPIVADRPLLHRRSCANLSQRRRRQLDDKQGSQRQPSSD